MLPDIGYTHRYPPDPLPGLATSRSAAPRTGLATGAREGGDASRRLASMPVIAWGLPCAPQGGPSSYTYIFYVHLQDVSRGTQAVGADHEGFLQAQPPT